MPAGWVSDVDRGDPPFPGEWRIIPPGGTPSGADNGINDVIAVHVRIAASAADCSAVPQPGVGITPTAIATYWASLAGLVTTTPQAVTVGGLSGLVMDITISPTWTKTCPYSSGMADVPWIVGLTNTDLDWPMVPGNTTPGLPSQL